MKRNRTSVLKAGVTTSYAYAATSHRLTKVGTLVRSYDAAGSTTKIGGNARQFVYDASGRMTQTKAGSTVQRNYRYNAKGEQLRSYVVTTANTYFVHDEAGHLLGEYDNAGLPIQQVIWFGDLPVGVLQGAGASQRLHYIEPDHLGTPRVVIDGQRNVPIWEWKLTGEAFGATPPNQDPDADGTAFVFDLRFPGQRYDSATGLNYNYFRDYDPSTGRYVESDPIGLDGGISTYAYVSGQPLDSFDRNGLVQFVGFNKTERLKIEAAFQNAIKTIKSCDGCTDCGTNGERKAYCLTEVDKWRLIALMDDAIYVKGDPTTYRGENIDDVGARHIGGNSHIIGPAAFSGGFCGLPAILVHEVLHFQFPGMENYHYKQYFVESTCFKCKRWK